MSAGSVRHDDVATARTTSGRATSECGAMNVTVIASIPHMSTGPLFDRLYAVEPDGVAWMTPSASTVPSGSPPIAHSSSTSAPDLRRRGDDVVDRRPRVPPACSNVERRQLEHDVVAGEHAPQPALELVRLHRREEPEPAEVDADAPARRGRGTSWNARSIVPSPPRTTTSSGSSSRHLRRRPRARPPHALDGVVEAVALAEQDADAPDGLSQRLRRSGCRCRREGAAPVGGSDGGRTPGFPSGRAGPSLRPRRLASPGERGVGDLAHDAPLHVGVADDALLRLRAAAPRTAA